MRLHYQFEDNWLQQDMTAMLQQDAWKALTMLSNPKLPAMFEHDNGYVCSQSIYADIKTKHKNVITFDSLLLVAKKKQVSLSKFLKVG